MFDLKELDSYKLMPSMKDSHATEHYKAGWNACIEYLKQRVEEENKLIPLTLEELKLMKGKYIWWDVSYGGYCLCRDAYVITEDATYSLDWVATHGHAYKTKPQNA